MPFKKVLILAFLIFVSSSLLTLLFKKNIPARQVDFVGSKIEPRTSPQNSVNFHYSFFSQKEFYDEAFENLRDLKEVPENVEGVIVNHHLAAPNLIAEALSAVPNKKPAVVVLISPNHFFAGRGQVISSLYSWKTPYGILEPDKKLIERLQNAELLTVEEEPFEKEHGISNVVAFIKKVFPSAKFVPLIVKDTFPFQSADVFADKLDKFLPQNSLVIASLDFSHYLPGLAADFHDEKSIAVLSNFDYNGIRFLDVDSKPTVRIFLRYLDLRNAKRFVLLNHSNSAKIVGSEKVPKVTSYITGFFSSGNVNRDKKIVILAVGDLMLDRYVGRAIEDKGGFYPFENIARLLSGNDITIANLEGSFTDFPPRPLKPDNTFFTFDPDLVPVLKRTGFNVFNLANNHSLNFGERGLIQSKNYLTKSQLNYFGDPQNKTDISIIKEIRGIKIGFVGFNELSGVNFENVAGKIRKIKSRADFVVVYTHWGNEYQTNFSKRQQEKAHIFVDAGANVVLGSHPHVIQPIEFYKGKLIFYSLGNFLFDQTFSKETQQGLAVGIVFDRREIDYYLFPTKIRNFQAKLTDGNERSLILKKLANNSFVPQIIKDQILLGKIKTNLAIYH